jgi:hypothetical protein
MNISHYAAKNLHDFFRPFGKVLTRPEYKKCFSMVKGMIQAKTVVLSEIGRKASSEILPKTFCGKVGTMLAGVVLLAEVQLRKFEGAPLELLIVDESDCQREHAEKIKGIIKVRDGSTGEAYGKGYGIFSVVAKTKEGSYAPLVLERFEEQNLTAEKIIKKVMDGLSPDHGGIWTMDRGFDDRKIFDLLLDNEQQFLVRIDRRGSQRLLVVGEENEKHLVSTLTAHMGEIGYRRVKLPGRKEVLTLIHYHRKKYQEPIAILTTLTPKTPKQAKNIAKLYLKRWKIEDYHRFVKTRLGLEEIMLQKPKRVDGLLALVLIASAFIMKLEQEKRDYALETQYQNWLSINNVPSSWSAFSRFIQKLFENWIIAFRTPPCPQNPLQLALIRL